MLSCGENNRAVVEEKNLKSLGIERFRLIAQRSQRTIFEGTCAELESSEPVILENEGDFVAILVLIGERYYPLEVIYMEPGIVTPKTLETPDGFIARIKEIASYGAEGKD